MLKAINAMLAQFWFSRQVLKLVAKYLMISSHGIIQFCKFGFHFPLQLELLMDKVNPFLSFLCPFYLRLLELLYHQVVPLSLFVNGILGQPRKQVGTASEARTLAKAPLINITMLAILEIDVFWSNFDEVLKGHL